MNPQQDPRGWQLHHHEQLFFKANIGAPAIRLKFFHYPSYRQRVLINQSPVGCKLRTKRDNMFYLFQQKARTKGTITLERIISIYPQPSTIPRHTTWGRISDIPWIVQRKYKQSFPYWPTHSQALQTISQEHWFAIDDLKIWITEANNHITLNLKYPEKQDRRLGADQALRTHTGDCDEFTDLFITLARIRGVPCRRLTGYFIHPSTYEPEPHAWAEILSPTKGWIPIDLALRTIGSHTINYIIRKIEEFNPALLDYQIMQPTQSLQCHWELPSPQVTALF